MALNGLPFNHSVGFGDGVAAASETVINGITSDDNLLGVMSWPDAGTSIRVDDVADFTVGDDGITAATIDLSGRQVLAIWTNAPSS